MVEIPKPPNGTEWELVVDTSRIPPFDVMVDDIGAESVKQAASSTAKSYLRNNIYPMVSYSSVILRSKGG